MIKPFRRSRCKRANVATIRFTGLNDRDAGREWQVASFPRFRIGSVVQDAGASSQARGPCGRWKNIEAFSMNQVRGPRSEGRRPKEIRRAKAERSNGVRARKRQRAGALQNLAARPGFMVTMRVGRTSRLSTNQGENRPISPSEGARECYLFCECQTRRKPSRVRSGSTAWISGRPDAISRA